MEALTNRAIAVTPQVWLLPSDAPHDGMLEQKARHVRADRHNRVTVTTAEQAVELLVVLGATQDHAEWQVRTALSPPSSTGEIHRQE